MSTHEIIAIDGPAASGKSTVGRLLAKELDYRFLDTGAMYRALTVACMRDGIDWADSGAVIACCRAAKITLVPGPQADRVLLDGEDVTHRVREPEVTARIHRLADQAAVRQLMVVKQREVAHAAPTVAVGRDMGTIVFQDARFKFYLDASEEVRATRRRAELEAAGESVDRQAMIEAIRRRDMQDMGRAIAPLKVADNAEVVDTSQLTIPQVVALLAEKIRGTID